VPEGLFTIAGPLTLGAMLLQVGMDSEEPLLLLSSATLILGLIPPLIKAASRPPSPS